MHKPEQNVAPNSCGDLGAAHIDHKHQETNNVLRDSASARHHPKLSSGRRVNTGSHPRPDLEGNKEFQLPTMSVPNDKAQRSACLSTVRGGWYTWWEPGKWQGWSDFCYRNWQWFQLSNDSKHSKSTTQLLYFSEIASNYGKSLPSGHSGEQSSTQVGVCLANGSPPLWLHEARKHHLLCYFKFFLQCDLWAWNEDRSLD